MYFLIKWVVVCGIYVVACCGAIAETNEALSRRLQMQTKARFLYTFATYVDWPKDVFQVSSNALVIGMLGKDPFGADLDESSGRKKFNELPVRCVRFQRVEDVQVCHVLFVAESEKNLLPQIAERLRGKNVLLVSDMDGFVKGGGHIQFVTEDRRVKFDVNLDAARRDGVKLDANLLRVARTVIRHDDSAEGK